MKMLQKNYTLTSAEVDRVSEDIALYLTQKKQKKEDIIKTRLNVETVLLHWLEHGFENKEFSVHFVKSFGRMNIRLILSGECCNPTQNDNEEMAEYMSMLQGNLGLTTSYEYNYGKNIYSVKLPMLPVGNNVKILLAIIASLLTWQISFFFPRDVVMAINTNVIDPTFSMLLSLIAAVATFLIFFNVCSAICGMGSLTTLSELGSVLMKRAQLHNVVWLVAGTGVAAVFFGVVDFSGGLTLNTLGDIYKMVLGIVPESILGPFVTGNTLQVLFLAAGSGILLLILGQQINDFINVIHQINLFLMTAINYFCYFVPIMIYLSFTSILLNGGFDSVIDLWKIMAVTYGVGVVAIFGETLWTAWESKFNIKQHFNRVMPVTLLALTTASTSACLPLMTKTLSEEGVADNYRDFALPFSQTIAVMGTVIGFPIAVLGLLSVYNQSISISALIVNMLSYLLLSLTLPPVAGSGISVMTLLILQAGLPKEAVATYITIDLFMDMMETCCAKTSAINNVFACAKKAGKMI